MPHKSHDPTILPADLPIPTDDGACLHLRRTPLPRLTLPSTDGSAVDLAAIGPAVLFFYPRTGIPGHPPPPGVRGESWDSIPGARGCTPQACGFRDLFAEFASLSIRVLGVSTNTLAHQREFQSRNHVPCQFLSDEGLALTRALRLPTFAFPDESGGIQTLLRRMAWFVRPDPRGITRIEKVWYPVFPPDRCAAEVLAWLKARLAITIRPPRCEEDRAFIQRTFVNAWGGTHIWSRRHRYELADLSTLIALIDNKPVGVLTYAITPGAYQCEVATLNALAPARGVGAALLDAAADAASLAGCERIFLTTSNDNMHAIEFYQRQGWRLCAVHPNAINAAREWKPAIPRIAPNGIPVRDELELELRLGG